MKSSCQKSATKKSKSLTKVFNAIASRIHTEAKFIDQRPIIEEKWIHT